jgi:hypothetical protein
MAGILPSFNNHLNREEFFMSKRDDLIKLALFGIASGSLILSKDPLQSIPPKNNAPSSSIRVENSAASQTSPSEEYSENNNESNMGYHLMTEEDLLLELSPEGESIYKSLSPEGKELALYVASQRCNYTNLCKGLNACKTEENECAGKGQCKGKGKCAFSDKNLAVKVVAEKMKQKRVNAFK